MSHAAVTRRPHMLVELRSAPFNWCDRRCERCPLANACAVARMDVLLAPEHESPSRDAEVNIKKVKGVLFELITTIGTLVANLRLDEGRGPPPAPDALLEHAADRVEDAFAELVRGADLGGPKARSWLVVSTAFVIGKARRISLTGPGAVDECEEGLADWDTSCNVVLLGRSIDELRRGLDALGPSERVAPLLDALDALAGALAPWIGRIPGEFHALFQELIRERAAPSPFCTVAN